MTVVDPGPPCGPCACSDRAKSPTETLILGRRYHSLLCPCVCPDSLRKSQDLYPWHILACHGRNGSSQGTEALEVIHHNETWISHCDNGTYKQKKSMLIILSPSVLSLLQCVVSIKSGFQRYCLLRSNIGPSLIRTASLFPSSFLRTATTSLIGPATSPGCFAVM